MTDIIKPSELKEYQSCERKYQLSRVDPFAKPYIAREAVINHFSSVLHDTIMFSLKQFKEYEDRASFKSIVQAWEKEWFRQEVQATDLIKKKAYVNWNEHKMSNIAVKNLRLLHEMITQVLSKKNASVCGCAITQDLHICDGVSLRADVHLCIERKKNPEDSLYDVYWFNTRRSPVHPAEYRHELAAAAIATTRHHGVPPKRLVLVHMGDARFLQKEVKATQNFMAQTEYLAYLAGTDKDFIPRIEPYGHCKKCVFSNICWDSYDWVGKKELIDGN